MRDALGPAGTIRVDANGGWDVDEAVGAIRLLERAAGGLEYVEQPCASIDELAELRRRVKYLGIPLAADESVRKAQDPIAVARAGAADIIVVTMADGSVRFIKNSINYFTWQAISTIRGSEAVSSDGY